MKRKPHETLKDTCLKRQKQQLELQGSKSLVGFPEDILELVFSHLRPNDVILLALVSRKFRTHLLHFVFNAAKAPWEQIISKKGDFKHKHLITTLRITEANSYNEYQQDTFGRLLAHEVFPRLSLVLVNSLNLSYWLKYNKCSHIKSLTLYSDNVRSVKIFHMAHVQNFIGLDRLCLHNYHFYWGEEEMPLLGISKLVLHDCTWEYPFNLARFNLLNSLRELSVSYSNNNAFMLLERFLNFLLDPFPLHSSSLRQVKVEFVDITENKKLLTPAILGSFLRAFDGLETLSLYGWTTNLNYLKNLLVNCTFEYPLNLRLKAEILDTSEINSVRVINSIPNLILNLTE